MLSAMPKTQVPHVNTQTRVTDPRLILGFRIACGVLAALAVTLIVMSVPYYIQDCGCPADVVAVWEQLGIASAVRIAFTTESSINALVFLILALLIVWRRPDELIAMLTAVFFVVFSAIFFTSPLAVLTVDWFDELYTGFVGIGVFVLPLWIHIFPSGRFVFGWMKWLFAGLVAIGAAALVFPDVEPYYVLAGMLVGVAGVGAQLYRYAKLATPVEKQQLKWLLLSLSGLAIYVLLFIGVELIFPDPFPRAIGHAVLGNLGSLAYLGIGLAVAFAIMRLGLWNVDMVINRSIVYGSLAALVIAMFFAALTGLQVTLGQTQPLLAAAIAGGFAIAIYQPVRKRVQAFVDERIYGLRFNQDELKQAQRKVPISTPGFLTGQVIEGYEVGELLGQGGMGEVYRAVGNDRVVAVKIMLRQFAADKDLLARFQREATISQKVKHANIARTLSSGVHDGTPYIIMEYVEGKTLANLLEAGAPLTPSTIVQIIKDVCAALSAAHQQDMVHRDLKPGNIMIRQSGEAVLLDFGVAKVSQASRQLTGSGVIGTIDYMAPEQIKAAAEVDARADIYALGVIGFQMLTGKIPFEGGLAQVMFAHLQKPAPDPRVHVQAIPDHMAGAVVRAMAKQPDERFATVSDFLQAMQGA